MAAKRPPSAASTAASASAATATAGKVAAKDLAQRLKDPEFQRDIEQAVRDLPPERAAELVAMLEASMKRRKLELYGYLAAAAIVVIGMIGSLVFMGSVAEGKFTGWVFLIPMGLAGLVMWLVGKRARAGQRAAKEAAERRAAGGAGASSRRPAP